MLMRWSAALFILLLSLTSLHAVDWTTSDGKVYKDVIVFQVADDGVTINYTGGTAKIPYYNLPLEIQKLYGHDPETLAAKAKAQAEDADTTQAAAEETRKRLEEQMKRQALDKEQVKALADARASLRAKAEVPLTRQTEIGNKAKYPGAEYSYDRVTDISYLDSPSASTPSLNETKTPTGERTSVIMRVETFGTQPQHPDKILFNILSVNSVWKLTGEREIFFLVDKTSMPLKSEQIQETKFMSGTGQMVEWISVALTQDQARVISTGKNVRFSVGANDYAIDPAALPKFQRYLAVVEQLPAPSPVIVRQYQHMANTLPSIPTIISKICEYIIVGSFSILVLLGLAGVFLAAARFLKL